MSKLSVSRPFCFWFIFGLQEVEVGSVSYYVTAAVVRCAQVLYTEKQLRPTANASECGSLQSAEKLAVFCVLVKL